jgi:hypothetical protein
LLDDIFLSLLKVMLLRALAVRTASLRVGYGNVYLFDYGMNYPRWLAGLSAGKRAESFV